MDGLEEVDSPIVRELLGEPACPHTPNRLHDHRYAIYEGEPEDVQLPNLGMPG